MLKVLSSSERRRKKRETERKEVRLIKTIAREPARNKSAHSFHPPISPSVSPSPSVLPRNSQILRGWTQLLRANALAPPTPRVLFVQTLAFIRYTNILNRVALSEVNAVHNQKPGGALRLAICHLGRIESERNKAPPLPRLLLLSQPERNFLTFSRSDRVESTPNIFVSREYIYI